MVKTLITGGTGFIGHTIAKHLVRSSESVRVMSRDPRHLPRSRRTPGTEFVKGNVFDPSSLEKAMEGCDAVINAVQFDNAPFENPRKGQTYERIDGEGSLRQVEAAKKAGVTRFIYISGAGTREGRDEPWFRAKAKAEKAVRESGMNWTIFRPSWVYGPGDRSLNKFVSFARFSPVVPLIGSGREKIQPVYVEDLAAAVQKSLNSEKTFEKNLEIGGPQSLSMREIASQMLEVLEKKRLILPHPKPLMKLIAFFVQFLPGRPLTPAGIDFVTMEEKVDNSELLRILEMELTPLKDGLLQYLSRNPNEWVPHIRRTATS